MSLRDDILEAVRQDRLDDLEALVSNKPRAVRYLMGLMYESEEKVRKTAARGIAIASRYHQKIVERIISGIVSSMSKDSGTNAVTAPEILRAIADERPELLLPVSSELVRLTADTSLEQGLCDTLRTVVNRCPGKVSQSLSKVLNEHVR
ncbi:MAG: hypothetical protein GY847_02825 [Proteobacteria bacterium]|nr:hypothetical protein [Pseudomonadota bacterium]